MFTQGFGDRTRLGKAVGCLLLVALIAACAGGASPTGPTPTGPGTTTGPSPAPTTKPTAVPPPTATPKPAATAGQSKASIAGTVAWSATVSETGEGGSTYVTKGSIHLVLDEDLPREFIAFRGRSTWSFDHERTDCSPDTHKEGTLETSVGGDAEPGYGMALLVGRMGQDFDIGIYFNEEWMAMCGYYSPDVATMQSVLNEFPGCEFGRATMTAVFDGVEAYRILCDSTSSNSAFSVTGHIEGVLTPYFQ